MSPWASDGPSARATKPPAPSTNIFTAEAPQSIVNALQHNTNTQARFQQERRATPSSFDKQGLAFNFWSMNPTTRNLTREVQIGRTTIGGDYPIAVQSMAATRTQDIEATSRQLRLLAEAGADVIRVAVDSKKDVEALAQIAPTVDVPLSVDLQENYRLVRSVAPHVQKIRYNPGHLYHHERDKPVADKVAFIADEAAKHDCALRVGVNCGSVDPAQAERFPAEDSISPMIASALATLRAARRRWALRATASRSRTPIRPRSLPPTPALPKSGPMCPCTSASPKPGCLPKA